MTETPAKGGAAAGGLTAAQVMGGIHDDAVEPGGELRLAPQMAQLGGQGGTDVLRLILGLGPAAGQPPGQPVDPVVMPVDPCGVGVFTSTRNAGIRMPYSRIFVSSREWIAQVCPSPPNLRIA